MSGGALNYGYSQIEGLADLIADGGRYKCETSPTIQRFAMLLRDASVVAKEIEWAWSGDTDPDEAERMAGEFVASHTVHADLRHELRLNATMLAKQTDLARAAENERDEARALAAEVAQGVTHLPHAVVEPCVRCELDAARAALDCGRTDAELAVGEHARPVVDELIPRRVKAAESYMDEQLADPKFRAVYEDVRRTEAVVEAARAVSEWSGCANSNKQALARCDKDSDLASDQWCVCCRLRAALAAYDKEPTP